MTHVVVSCSGRVGGSSLRNPAAGGWGAHPLCEPLLGGEGSVGHAHGCPEAPPLLVDKLDCQNGGGSWFRVLGEWVDPLRNPAAGGLRCVSVLRNPRRPRGAVHIRSPKPRRPAGDLDNVANALIMYKMGGVGLVCAFACPWEEPFPGCWTGCASIGGALHDYVD